MAQRVIVTRPQREAQRWIAQLEALGVDAEMLPLIAIAPPPDALPVVAAWQRLARYHAVMFVSGNAVEHFFALRPADVPWSSEPASTPRFWATGPGTAYALRQAGVDERLIDAPAEAAAQFDSEALWQQVGPALPSNARVLIVRGAEAGGQSAGRPWLAERLADAGAGVDLLVAYQRQAPSWQATQMVRAQGAASDGSVWLFSSSEALGHLRRLLPSQGWQTARCVATHPRIADAAREAGFGVVCVSRPTLGDIVASIESFG